MTNAQAYLLIVLVTASEAAWQAHMWHQHRTAGCAATFQYAVQTFMWFLLTLDFAMQLSSAVTTPGGAHPAEGWLAACAVAGPTIALLGFGAIARRALHSRRG